MKTIKGQHHDDETCLRNITLKNNHSLPNKSFELNDEICHLLMPFVERHIKCLKLCVSTANKILFWLFTTLVLHIKLLGKDTCVHFNSTLSSTHKPAHRPHMQSLTIYQPCTAAEG